MPITPPYNWICHSCYCANDADVNVCSSCGHEAISSAREVGSRHTAREEEAKTIAPTKNPDSILNRLLLVAFGLYLIAGAYVSVTEKKWPWFMPPQFDFIALVTGGWESVSAAYITGGITGLIGLFCVGAGVFLVRPKA